jgi:isocitrate dehydrogenase (NAD+)
VFQLYANIRPSHSWEGVESRYHDLDWVVFRENTEDTYTGEERFVTPDVVEGIKRNSRSACRRIALAGLQHAQNNNRRKVTFIHKVTVFWPCRLDGLFIVWW